MLRDSFTFKYTWRSYQQRFLKDFDDHIADNHLHVVAPPGSGKTVLGLEMMRRVNQKTLVLAPTITIRNQWEERMFECFVSEKNTNELRALSGIEVSQNIKKPGHITFATYQSLHAFAKNEMEGSMDLLVDFFAKAGIKNIILDEAHHLKNEWWKPLFALKKIEGCTLTALTATPPYDSEQREIAKYFQLCGPIDIEISVPELIKEGNLCVHQDYIYFSEPDEEQIQYILKYRVKSMDLLNNLVANDDFGTFVLEHNLYTLSDGKLDSIYENPDFYVAILVYLNARGHDIPKERYELLGIDEKQTQLPSFNQEWAERLLQPILVTYREDYIKDEEVLLEVEKQLRRIGAFDKNRVDFKGQKELYKSLAQSPNKLKSIQEIIDFESAQMGSGLRAVILTDYIRKEFLESGGDDLRHINKLGVIPIFHHLRHSLEQHPDRWQGKNKLEKLAVLSGTLVIIHHKLEAQITRVLDSQDYTLELLIDTEFIIIKPRERAKNEMVSIITSLFTDGHIEILIGTAALLGEGWDAPAINTLILASYVSSFVMSNQMRGRAIRIEPRNPDKVASVWHLACLDPTADNGGEDIAKLRRRFDAFCGVSLDNEPFIENGADRCNLPREVYNKESLNESMRLHASQRDVVKARWSSALSTGRLLVHEVKLDYSPQHKRTLPKKIYHRDLVKSSFLQIGALVTIAIPEIVLNNVGVYFSRGITYFFYAVLSSVAMLLIPKTYKAIVRYLKYGRVDKQVEKMAQAVLKSLRVSMHITTQVQELKLGVEYLPNGEVACFLTGATAREEILFTNGLQELLAPIDNPRYMIEQRGWFQRKFGFANYYAVPSLLTGNKKDAQLFYKYWQIYVGKSALVFTRTLEGRKQLLKARFHYLNSEDTLKTKESAIWK